MQLPVLFFIVVAVISIGAAVGVISSRLPIHSALFLLTHFVTLAVLYITLEAQFLAAAQIIVYAGGIVILMLFVIMLIGSESIESKPNENRSWTPLAGMGMGIVLLGAIVYSLEQSFRQTEANGSALQGGVPTVVGMDLFTKYTLPVELVAVLLLVALLGAMLLARRPNSEA